jgi:hypothetical protein
MSTSIEPRVKAGKFLLKLAWFIEIGAALVGLALAWFILFAQIENIKNPDGSLSTKDQIIVFVAAIPFVIIAIVELTKIPLATACYFSTSRLAKYVFGFSLFLLSIITFETFINGFQQNIQVRLAGIKKIQLSMRKAETEIKTLEVEKIALTGLTRQEIEKSYSDKIIELTKRQQTEIDAIEAIMEKERKRLGGSKPKVLRQEIDDLKNESMLEKNRYQSMRDEAVRRYEQQLKAISSDTEGIKKDLVDRISALDKEINNISSKKDKKENEIKVVENESIVGSKEEKVIQDKFKEQRARVEEIIESEKVANKQRADELNASLQELKKERADNFLPHPDLDVKIEKKELDLEEISINRMSLNIKTQSKELDDQEKKAILDVRNRIKAEKTKRIERLQNEKNLLTRQEIELKSQKDSLAQQLTSTTKGNQSANLSNKSAEEMRRLNDEQVEKQKQRTLLIKNNEDELVQIMALNQTELIPKENAHTKEIDNISEKIRKTKQDEEDFKTKNISDLNRRDFRLGEIRDLTIDLKKKQSEDEGRLMEEGGKTQIGQWSMFFFDNIDPKNVRLVSIVWFGSIAAITAWTGTLLAFASLVLRFGHEKGHRPSRLIRTLQHFFIDARKYIRKPRIKEIEKEVVKIVEVIKEVPVTKVVTQEVIKEVIRKEVIHVPIASDDLTILNIKSNKSNKASKDTKNKLNPKL